MKATVSSKGQITIPAEIRRRLGIRPGTRLRFIVHADGKLEIVRAGGSVRDLKGFLPKPKRRLSLAEMDAAKPPHPPCKDIFELQGFLGKALSREVERRLMREAIAKHTLVR